MRTIVLILATLLSSSAASAQSFDAANKYLSERSYSRACVGFRAYLKASPTAALAREAKAKAAHACMRVGKANRAGLQKLATTGKKDFGRAYAAFALAERNGQSFETAIKLLSPFTGDSGRVGKEATALLLRGAFIDLDRNAYNVKVVGARVRLVLKYSKSANASARARFALARVRLRDRKTVATGENELRAIGSGKTEWADDALYLLGQTRENTQKFTEALELYDEVSRRFDNASSNTKRDAERRAKEIRRPWVSVSVSSVDLPGVKPQISASWRNVRKAVWRLHRVDPLALKASDNLPWPGSEDRLLKAGRGVASKWSSTLEEKVKHAQGSSSFALEKTEPGIYVLEFEADGQRALEWVLVTRTATLTKTDRDKVLIWVSDVETGKARANAEVALFIDESGPDRKLTGRTDKNGLAHFNVGASASRSMMVWTRSGKDVSLARAGGGYSSSRNTEELGYVMFDRPLYKPGETVGLKLFLRAREGGPSTPLEGRTVKVTVTDPAGKKVAEPTLTTNDFGTAQVKVPLAKTATLGQYYASISASGKYYRANSYTFRVEEYKPPEYLVTVEPLSIPKPGEAVKFKVKAKYYSGGAVAKAKGRALVTIQGWNHSWAPWPDAQTSDDDVYSGHRGRGRYRNWYGQLASHTLLFVTGDDGTAEVEVPALPNAPGMDLQYSVQVFVIDASRREIPGQGKLHASSSPYFADLRTDHYLYRPGERVTVKLRAEDANGKPSSPELLVRLVRINDQGKEMKIAETRTKLKGGTGLVQLDADALGQVRAEVAAADQPDTVLAQTDLWLTSETRPITPPNVGFQLYLDRAPLEAGQKARVLVVTPRPGGHVLLTTEGESITSTTVLEMKGRARFVEVPLTVAMTPNVFMTLSRFENAQQLRQQRGLKVKGSKVELKVKVGFNKAVAEPGTTVSARIAALNAKRGLELETALTVVDEALFSIEPEKKDFLSFFGRLPRRLTVRTTTSHNERWYRPRPVTQLKQPELDGTTRENPAKEPQLSAPSPATLGMADSAAEAESFAGGRSSGKSRRSAKKSKDSRSGADDDMSGPGGGGAAPIKARTDFSTSSGWFASLSGQGSTPRLQRIKLTDSLTSWKAVATVVSQGPNLGVGSATLRTEKPLMVRLQGPRFFVEGDEVVLSAVVESQLTKTAKVDVTIKVSGFKAMTPSRARLTVEPGKPQRFDARFKVTSVGEQKIRAVVKGAGSSDAMEWKLNAFVHGSAQRAYSAKRLSDTVRFEFEVPAKRKASLTRLELTLSPSLLAVMFDGLPYLAQYPYGCVEQTLSRFVPAAIAQRAVKDLGLPSDRVPKDLGDMVQKGLERLADFQHGDGGWGWWKADSTNTWMTAYVVYALSLGKEAGLSIDDSMVARGRKYLVSHLGEIQKSPENHAFVVFALSQTGKVPAQAMTKAFANRTRLSNKGRALVALALISQKDRRARIAVENLDDVVKAAQARSDASVGVANDVWSTSEAIEATAFTLMAMQRYDKNSKLVAPLTDFLVLRRNGGRWRNTRDTAFAIYALSDLARIEKAAGQSGSFKVLVNGKLVKRIPYAKGGLDLGEPLVLDDKFLKAGTNVIEVKRDGGGTGYAAATLDVFNMNDFIKGVGGDVKVKRSYTILGKPSTEKTSAPTEYGMAVESGLRVRVDLEVTANKAVEFVMIEDLKPAGFEAVMTRSGPAVCNYACAHAELRIDRVAMFLSSLSVGTTKLSYELRSEVPGKFAALPARVEAMYAPEIQATSDEMRFEVRD